MSERLMFPASIIGSMPRPAFVRELISDDSNLAPTEYRRLMSSAVHYVVALQEAAGLDVVSDGEWWRKSYIGVIAELAHGFELSHNPADGRPWTIVVDKLTPKQPGFIAQEVAFLKKLTNRQIKATLPAPALLGPRLGRASSTARPAARAPAPRWRRSTRAASSISAATFAMRESSGRSSPAGSSNRRELANMRPSYRP